MVLCLVWIEVFGVLFVNAEICSFNSPIEGVNLLDLYTPFRLLFPSVDI